MYKIAISGKGGVGKTTIAGLIVHYLAETINKTLLAVDADPNANLNEILGITYEKSISDIREGTLDDTSQYGFVSKDQIIEHLLQRYLVEQKNYDFLVMGRPEGKKCYCFVNNILRRHLDKISTNYDYVLIDNEAGMEHLSRMTTNNVDLLVIVSDSSMRGLRSAVRIQTLIKELNIEAKKIILVINKVRKSKREDVKSRATALGFQNIYLLPLNEIITDLDEEGKPLTLLSKNNEVYQSIINIFTKILKLGSITKLQSQIESIENEV